MAEARLQIRDLSYSYGSKNTIEDIALDVYQGQFVGLIGPNGSGKSTVLKNIYRALHPSQGEIRLDGENIGLMSYKNLALKIAVVGQENEVPFDFSVKEIVAMGRSPHKKMFELDTKKDKEIVLHALEHVGLHGMENHNFLHLSGGEKQRVLIARAVAQESDLFILDEPTNHLDISYQMQIFDFIKRLGITTISAVHDLNLAALYCDYIYVMKDGKVVLQGTPKDILTEDNIYDIYGVKNSIIDHAITGKPSITYLPAEFSAVYKERKQ